MPYKQTPFYGRTANLALFWLLAGPLRKDLYPRYGPSEALWCPGPHVPVFRPQPRMPPVYYTSLSTARGEGALTPSA
jgi:hypothetical protein